MFMYTILVSSFNDVLLAALALPLAVGVLRLVLGRLSAHDLEHSHQNLEPRQCEASGSKTPDPAPSYLASSADDEELIGGNPIHLSPPRGPTGTSVTFRVFTPPSYDKEIPKVDLYGALNFVRTGEVRTFVSNGTRRLLVINYQERTLAVHVMKEGKKKKRNDIDGGLLFSNSTNVHVVRSGMNSKRASLLREPSTKNADFKTDHRDVAEDSEEAWNPRRFEPKPILLLRLNDLVTVAAMPPRHGGVVEVTSRMGTKLDDGENPIEDPEKKNYQKAKPSIRGSKKKQQQSLNRTEVRRDKLHTSKMGGECRSDYVTTDITKDDYRVNDSSSGDRRDEFAFRTPRDAAEFQRTIMCLRTVGKEISYLYETLEVVPTKEVHQMNETSQIFSAPGVALDDAWHCFNEIPILRKGLHQYFSRRKEKDDKKRRNSILEAGSEHSCKKGGGDLGLVDFISLFLPPLPIKDSQAIACFTPCAKTESALLESDPDLMLTRGIEWHYQHLSFVSALQRLVSRAALYVRVYAWARVISRDGWHLRSKSDEGSEREDDLNGQAADELSNRVQAQNGNENSGCDNTVQMGGVGEDANNMVSEPLAISSSGCWSPPLSNSHHQGYSCVGWYAFRCPPLNEESNTTGKSKQWLSPEYDPLNCIPSLQSMVERYPHAHFFVFSHFNEKSSHAVYFLLVRSFPIGVDRTFDDTMHNFVCKCAEERDKSFGISVQLKPGDGSLLLTKMTFKAVLVALRHLLMKAAGANSRKEEKSQWFLSECLASNLTSLWHYGGSLQKRDGLPMNYFAINSQYCHKKIPSIIGRWLLGVVRGCLEKTSVVACRVCMKTFSSNVFPERVITSISMINTDLNTTLMEFEEVPELKGKEDSRISADSSQEKADCSINSNLVASADLRPDSDVNCRNHHDELYGNNIDAIYELLGGMAVPFRRRDQTRGEHSQDNRGEVIKMEQISGLFTRSDVERYLIACECDLKRTLVRIVESAAWRAIMFPVDTRLLKIEMQSGQFFQQGCDKEKNPIFYLRNMLLGPWRNDINATALSILHRLEKYFLEVDPQRPGVKFTLIAFGGHPENGHGQRTVKRKAKKQTVDDNEQSACHPGQCTTSSLGSDPRIDPYEEYQTHSNTLLLRLFTELLPRHYPERLAKALFVPGGSWKKSRLRINIPSCVTVLSSIDHLKKYVDDDELVIFAGGNAKVSSDAFQCDYSFDHVGT